MRSQTSIALCNILFLGDPCLEIFCMAEQQVAVLLHGVILGEGMKEMEWECVDFGSLGHCDGSFVARVCWSEMFMIYRYSIFHWKLIAYFAATFVLILHGRSMPGPF